MTFIPSLNVLLSAPPTPQASYFISSVCFLLTLFIMPFPREHWQFLCSQLCQSFPSCFSFCTLRRSFLPQCHWYTPLYILLYMYLILMFKPFKKSVWNLLLMLWGGNQSFYPSSPVTPHLQTHTHTHTQLVVPDPSVE